MPRKALGRGLEALIPNADKLLDPAAAEQESHAPTHDDDIETAASSEAIGVPPTTTPSRDLSAAHELTGRRGLVSGRATAVIEVPLDRMTPNPYQPRVHFEEQDLEDLAQSIRAKGILQAVLVRRRGLGYELIAGDRRVRAARRAGLASVPAIVREAHDRDMLELAIIENQQRVDLNPIEVAEAYARAIKDFDLSPDELADVVGKDRTTVANMLRLVALPDEVKNLVQAGRLQMGHARALAGIKDPNRCVAVARRAAQVGASVRAVEELARDRPARRAPGKRKVDPEVERFEDRLRQRFGTRVQIARRGERGRVEIEFYSRTDLERILDELGVLDQG